MLETVKRIGLVVLALAAAVTLLAVGYVQGLVPGTSGCALRSVNKAEYVDANQAVFRTIPLPRELRDAYSTTWAHPVPAAHACLPLENGPPYDAYLTTRVYLGSRLGFDERILRGWTRTGAAAADISTFRRGDAALTVTTTSEGVLLSVDHRGYVEPSG